MLTDPILVRYAQELRKRGDKEGLDLLVPDNEVYDLIREHVGESAYDVIELISSKIKRRVVKDVAVAVAREFYGEVDEGQAVDRVSRRIAMWYLEILEKYGFIRLSRRR